MNYSRPFMPGSDHLVSSGTYENPCLTNFYVAPFASFIASNEKEKSFVVGKAVIAGKPHFTLETTSSPTKVLVGDLPCPENCLPGQPLAPYYFDQVHINNIISDSPLALQYICIHRCKTIDKDTFAMYGHTGTIPLIDPNLGHKIYVAG